MDFGMKLNSCMWLGIHKCIFYLIKSLHMGMLRHTYGFAIFNPHYVKDELSYDNDFLYIYRNGKIIQYMCLVLEF